jgi:hypothetical protein
MSQINSFRDLLVLQKGMTLVTDIWINLSDTKGCGLYTEQYS